MADYRNEFETPTPPGSSTFASDTRTYRRSRGTAFAVVIALALVVVAVGFFFAHSGLNKKTVAARLQEWTAYAGQVAEAEGYIVTLTYSDIVIEGGLFQKRAKIVNPVITLSMVDVGPEGTRTITTPAFYLTPTLVGSNVMTLSVTDPIKINDGRGIMRLTSGEAIDFRLEEYNNNSGSGLAYAFSLPPHLTIEALSPNSDAVARASDIGFGSGSAVNGRIDRVAGTFRQDATLSNITLTEGERTIAIEGFTSQVETASENGTMLTHYLIHLAKLDGNGLFKGMGPIDADIDLELTEPEAGDGAAINQSLDRERNVTLESTLALPSTQIIVKGQLRTVPEEMVPFGNATVEIGHPDQFLNALEQAGQLQGVNKQVAVTMMSKVAPTWKGGDTPLMIPLKREQNAPFYLGSLTFENFTAQLLAQLLNQENPGLFKDSTINSGPTQQDMPVPGQGEPAQGAAMPDAAAPSPDASAPAGAAPADQSTDGEEGGEDGAPGGDVTAAPEGNVPPSE